VRQFPAASRISTWRYFSRKKRTIQKKKLLATYFLLVVIEPLRSSRLAGELAVRMPAGLMLILVVYLLRDVPTQTPPAAAVSVAAALVVAVLHLWRCNALLSIFGGTSVFVLATNLLIR
jgi:branched-subunit amino acid transport protein AzlD